MPEKCDENERAKVVPPGRPRPAQWFTESIDDVIDRSIHAFQIRRAC